jgi:hypothetical protein
MDLFDSKTVVALLIGLAGIVMIVVGIQVVGGSKRAQYSDTMRTGFNAIVGTVLIAMGAVAGVIAVVGKRALQFLGWA